MGAALRRVAGACRAGWVDRLGAALPTLYPALPASPVLQPAPARLTCGLDHHPFPPRGSRTDVFRPAEVLLTCPGLPECAALPAVRRPERWPAWTVLLLRFRRPRRT